MTIVIKYFYNKNISTNDVHWQSLPYRHL